MPWSKKQKGIVKSYQRYAGIPDAEYRAMLYEYTGSTSSTDRTITQFAFDVFMPILESRAHLVHVNGGGRGRLPVRGLDWHYWRNRIQRIGAITSRELFKIDALWEKLKPRLPPEQRAARTKEESPWWYLHLIAGNACGHDVANLAKLTTAEGQLLIEALKDRLKYALRKAS